LNDFCAVSISLFLGANSMEFKTNTISFVDPKARINLKMSVNVVADK
jgi:hypothetical protein